MSEDLRLGYDGSMRLMAVEMFAGALATTRRQRSWACHPPPSEKPSVSCKKIGVMNDLGLAKSCFFGF